MLKVGWNSLNSIHKQSVHVANGVFTNFLIIAFLSAFMSTVSTQINWGSSYIVNDFYARFVRKENSFSTKSDANNHRK